MFGMKQHVKAVGCVQGGRRMFVAFLYVTDRFHSDFTDRATSQPDPQQADALLLDCSDEVQLLLHVWRTRRRVCCVFCAVSGLGAHGRPHAGLQSSFSTRVAAVTFVALTFLQRKGCCSSFVPSGGAQYGGSNAKSAFNMEERCPISVQMEAVNASCTRSYFYEVPARYPPLSQTLLLCLCFLQERCSTTWLHMEE